MLEAYSLNVTVAADSPIPFNSVSVAKGCSAVLTSPSTISLNKCGVYKVECDVSAAAANTIQLYKDGVAQPQAQSTGTSPNFSTLVQVDHDNSCCPCASPTLVQIRLTTAATLTDANVVVTKIA